MKLNRIFLASILLLAILAIGAASASEDISDDIAAVEPTDDVVTETVEDDLVDEVVAESVGDEPVDEAISESVDEMQSNDNSETSDDCLGTSYGYQTSNFTLTLSDLNVDKDYFSEVAIGSVSYSNNEDIHINFYVNNEYRFSLSKSSPDQSQSIITPTQLGIDDYGEYKIQIGLDDLNGIGFDYEDVIVFEKTLILSDPGSFDVGLNDVITSIFYEDNDYNVIIRINSESTQSGVIRIFVDGVETKSYQVTEGKIEGNDIKSVSLNDLGIKSGIYDIKVTFTDDEYDIEKTLGEQVVKVFIYYIPQFAETNDEQPYVLNISLPNYISGRISVYNGTRDYDHDTSQYVYYRDKYYGSAEIIDGRAVLELPIIGEGISYLIVDFPCIDGTYTEWIMLQVLKNSENVTVSVSSEIEEGSDAIVNFKSSYTGALYIYVDNKSNRIPDVSSYVYRIPNLSLGTHKVKVLFIAEGSYRYIYTFTVNVKEKSPIPPIPTVPAKIVANDYSAYYNKGTYSVTVYGTDGKVAKGANVVFKINGKNIATIKTDAKGVAKVKIPNSYVPKAYKITATALGKTVTKKLTVKQVLKLKKVAVKKSADKLIITATLKEGKKALKGKKITFRFNGEKYTAKTNKKGIAKITIKAKVLKKLKVGKKITYKATYLKDTVKRTVKVKK